MPLFRNPFSVKRSKPRRATSRSPLKLPADVLAREFGSTCPPIDAVIGNQRVAFEPTQGEWISDGTTGTAVSSREMAKLEKKKRELEEDNNILRTKLDVLLEMLAEVTAEHDLRGARA